ncbi:MAG: nucleotide sugar dehydrogenase [Candidatus Omnitrophica bacterium]|nr:nucleotide sugar dehydrogenase [Candidatus Omnitrophota bacterium]
MNNFNALKKKIREKTAVVTVVGLGYVGLPIALEFCKKGFTVIGFDTSEKRIRKLRKKESYINDISCEEIRKIFKKGEFTPTTKDKVLSSSDVIIICVPTPLRKIKDPDISYIIRASKTLSSRMRPGQLIVVESTTYPGTTRDKILPELLKSGCVLDEDFFLAFSPERIDPGNKKYGFTNIPKVVGGLTDSSTKLGELLYSKVVKKVVGVSKTEVAEVTKLLENTFRIVNIALINEFAMLCDKLDIDVWEVISAASTKPFGFMPFYPGPGIGGHCIPADPMYLSWKARTVGFRTEMIDLAAQINRMMPVHVVRRIGRILKKRGQKLEDAKVLVVGVTYKKDVNDLRESPALDMISALQKRKAGVKYHDPYIPYLDISGIRSRSVNLTPGLLKKQDIVLIATDHSDLDYAKIVRNSKLVFDTRNVLEEKSIKSDNIIKL